MRENLMAKNLPSITRSGIVFNSAPFLNRDCDFPHLGASPRQASDAPPPIPCENPFASLNSADESRSRRGDSSRRGTIESLDRNAADDASRRSATGKVIEADGAPLVGTDDLKKQRMKDLLKLMKSLPFVDLGKSISYCKFQVQFVALILTNRIFITLGTAGVWRISAIHDAGGWNDRTTVEDMDLSVCAGLKGWKFVYAGDIKVKNELPSTFKAYQFQQHRWSCGPANLFKKMAFEIITNKKVSFGKKLYVLYSFFFVGKIVAHTVTFIFYCVIIPISVFVPEVEIPYWGAVYVPALITLCKSVATPSLFHLIVIWVLFENVMSFHRLKAAITGLLEARRVNEWIVTEKLGDGNKPKANSKEKVEAVKYENCEAVTMPLIEKPKNKPKRSKLWQRIYVQEIGLGVMLLICGFYDAVIARRGYFIYLFLQGITFIVMGYGYVGTYVPGA